MVRCRAIAGDLTEVLGRFNAGGLFVMLDRGDYWQCAYVIPKGAAEPNCAPTASTGCARHVAPYAGLRASASSSRASTTVKLLTVAVDRLETWWYRPGLLCIGDAAHAMSPIGGVGINLAIQDAVAAANILAAPLREKATGDADLAAVQKRRFFPAKITQAIQVAVQNNIIAPMLAGTGEVKVPFAITLMQWFPVLRRIPARITGTGVRPEHVQTTAIT